MCIRVADHNEDLAQVEGDEGIPGPLSEQSHGSSKRCSASHSRCGDHIPPGLLGDFGFQMDGGLDLYHLGLDEYGFAVSFSMVLDENLESFFSSVFADEVTRRFGDETAPVSHDHILTPALRRLTR